MNNNTYKCIDAGSENCPCELAVTGDCLTCSRLQGKDECDCNWRGVCILNEFFFNGRKANNRRREKECEIASKYYTSEDFFIMVIRVQKGFAIRCMRPAVYVFLRNPEFEHHYDIPVSILDVNLNDSTITVGVRILSAKTKSLAEAEDTVLVRGPYRSGFIGRQFRKMEGSILFLCSGAGVCPGIFACNLLRPSAKVFLTARDATFEKSMVQRFLKSGGIMEGNRNGNGAESSPNGSPEKYGASKRSAGGSVVFRDFESPQEMEKIRRFLRMEHPDHVIILGSHEFTSRMYHELEEFHRESNFITSNDSNICCGEGICGACEFTMRDGKKLRMCKCSESVDLSELFPKEKE